jgi:hypothetical protein
MNKIPKYRSFFNFLVIIILTLLLFVAPKDVAFAQPVGQSLELSPTVVKTGESSKVVIKSGGFFDLSEIRQSQIGIRPNEGISDLRIVDATAQSLDLSFKIANTASAGIRTLFIKNTSGATVVALNLTLRLGLGICKPLCQAPNICRDNVCVPPPPPPRECKPPCDPNSGEECKNGACVLIKCRPPCTDGKLCISGRCQLPM